MHRMKELYGWGDITREQYLVEREVIHKELQALAPIEEHGKNLSKLAQFLTNVADAWDAANQEQRNKLARCLFQEVWIKDNEVVAVKPQPELKPFFDLNYEAMQEKLSQNFGKWRPRGGSEYHVRLSIETFPVMAPLYLTVPDRPSRKLPPSLWPEVVARHKGKSLRELAEEYRVSRESVRRVLISAGVQDGNTEFS